LEKALLSPDRLFDPEPNHKAAALHIYSGIKDLPIISPHGHVDPSLFSDPGHKFGNPVELLLQPDHYILRMLYSQGIPYEHVIGVDDPRAAWQLFAENFYLFRGTPSGLWLSHELEAVFGVDEKLDGNSASGIYDRIDHALRSPAFSPRKLFERLNIEVLATTDKATDTLSHHSAVRSSGWNARIIPTFRPDALIRLDGPRWHEEVQTLSTVSGLSIVDFRSFIAAIEQRRTFFRAMGAAATDMSAVQPDSAPVSPLEVDDIFQRALQGQAAPLDAIRFSAHMLYEMARMSVEDGLVMQLHPGALRNYNDDVHARFGPDRGFDIPVTTDFTRNLEPLLKLFGNHPNFHLILFTLDESTYARELAPLAGAYPSVKLGPPWWFHDSWNGMRRYFDQVMETAGLYNTAGFNDDTRAFLSIPARHDVWRRSAANWLAGLLVRHVIDRQDAESMAYELAVGLARKAYRLDGASNGTYPGLSGSSGAQRS
jgi:glucuronate isomerase